MMAVRFWWLAVAACATGCIRDSLVACGDLSCPVGQSCVNGAICATPDEIAACNGMPDGTGCQSATATGYCTQGVCIANVCGDGQVTGTEVCDGDQITATCADLGYYTGTPTCTPSCTLDPGTCSGKCGDGIVQSDEGEQCYGSAPSTTCADFGRDYGVLGCDRFCQPAINADCQSFGWRAVLAPQPAITEIAIAGNAQGVIGIDTQSVRLSWGASTTTRANPGWTIALADSATFVAIGASSYGWYDGIAWHDVPLALDTNDSFAVEAGALYAITASGQATSIDLPTGMVTPLPTLPGTSCLGVVTQSSTVYAITSTGLVHWTGSVWAMDLARTTLASVQRGATGTLWLSNGTPTFEVFDITSGGVTQTPNLSSLGLSFTVDADGDILAFDPIPGMTIQNLRMARYSSLTPVTPVSEGMVGTSPDFRMQADDGSIIGAAEGVYRLAAVSGPVQIAPSPVGVNQISVLADGAIALCGDEMTYIGPAPDGAAHATTWSNGTCVAMIGDPRLSSLAASSSGVYHYAPATTTYSLVRAGSVAALIGTVNDAWALFPNTNELSHGVAGTWTTVAPPTGCTVIGIAGGGPNPLAALLGCGAMSVIAEYSAGTWTTIVSSPQVATLIAMAPDGTIYASGNQTVRIEGSAIKLIGPASTHVLALSATEVYIDAGTGTYLHLLGSDEATIRLPSGPIEVAPDALYAWSIADGELVMVTRMPTLAARYGL